MAVDGGQGRACSQSNERAAAGRVTKLERTQGVGLWHGQVWKGKTLGGEEDSPIGQCVGDQQDDLINPA